MTTEQKIDKILDIITTQGNDIAVMKSQMKTFLEHDQRLTSLEKNQNRATGALVIVGSLFSAFIAWIFKKFD